jgi:hypothetical protein
MLFLRLIRIDRERRLKFRTDPHISRFTRGTKVHRRRLVSRIMQIAAKNPASSRALCNV